MLWLWYICVHVCSSVDCILLHLTKKVVQFSYGTGIHNVDAVGMQLWINVLKRIRWSLHMAEVTKDAILVFTSMFFLFFFFFFPIHVLFLFSLFCSYFILNGLERVVRLLILPKRNYVSKPFVLNTLFWRENRSCELFKHRRWSEVVCATSSLVDTR